MKEQEEIITGNRRGLKLIFCCLLLTLVCCGLACAQHKAKLVNRFPCECPICENEFYEFYEHMLPEYDLTKRELYSKLIDATYKLNRTDSSDRSYYRPQISFYTNDSIDYCSVVLWLYDKDSGVKRGGMPLTGFAVINGDTILIKIDNDTKIPLKSSRKKKIRSYYSPHLYHDAFFARFRMEGRNARLVNIMFREVETE